MLNYVSIFSKNYLKLPPGIYSVIKIIEGPFIYFLINFNIYLLFNCIKNSIS